MYDSAYLLLQEEEEYIRKNALKGIILNHTDDLFIPINNRPLVDDDEDEQGGAAAYKGGKNLASIDVSGLDAANSVLSETVFGKLSVDDHPEKRRKVGYRWYLMIQLTYPCIPHLPIILPHRLYTIHTMSDSYPSSKRSCLV